MRDAQEPGTPDVSHPAVSRERLIPGEDPPVSEAAHRARYNLALGYIGANSTALDAGCGAGYGAAMLAERAGQVYGVDASPHAVDFARQHFRRPNLEFRCADCLSLPFPESSMDVVTSFEVLEHVADQTGFLHELARVLKPDGVVLISTPVRGTSTGDNPFHLRELSPAELEQMLTSEFGDVRVVGQRLRARRLVRKVRRERVGLRRLVPKRWQTLFLRLIGERATADMRRDEVEAFELVDDVPSCDYMVAIARVKRSLSH